MIRKPLLVLLPTLAAILAVAAYFSTSAEARGGGTRVEVTITNLTRGQVFSPAVVALHGAGLHPIFTPGAPASDELRQVAEDAVNQPLIDLLSASPDVGAVATLDGPLPPGQTASVELEAKRPFAFVSLVGMLVTTNDGFYGVNAAGPAFGRFTREVEAYAYDAGTEENNELCAYIPGPPCGNAGVRAMNGEGFVHVHAGVHGIGDLVPAMHDWRNPVARITVRRVH
jgi:hypothetical protein